MQSKIETHIETAADTVLAFCISWIVTITVHVYFDLSDGTDAAIWVSLFTVISYVRRYLTRRLFNRLKYGVIANDD